MTRSLFFALATLLATVSPVLGQYDTGGLPQTVQWGMQQAMRDLEAKSLGITEEYMKEEVGAEALQDFIEGAVVRLILSPEGSFAAYTLEGGDLVSFKLGKQQVAVTGDGDWEDPWVARSGEFAAPKKPQKLTLNLDARGQEVQVECFNKYGKSETDVTYYVGPLNGLFCMGLTDEDVG